MFCPNLEEVSPINICLRCISKYQTNFLFVIPPNYQHTQPPFTAKNGGQPLQKAHVKLYMRVGYSKRSLLV